ncbi:hypothetical protein VXO70_23235, partial [Escherichia coli]
DGNGSHASTLKSPSYTKSVSWQHYPVHAPSHPQHQSIRALQTIMRLSLSHLSYAKKIELISSGAILRIK